MTVSKKEKSKEPQPKDDKEKRSKTLLEIQQEEERTFQEKLKQQQELLEAHRKNLKVSCVFYVYFKIIQKIFCNGELLNVTTF